MAVELEKFISEQLEKMSKDHIDRPLLEAELAEIKAWEGLKRKSIQAPVTSGEISVEEGEVEIARVDLNHYVNDFDKGFKGNNGMGLSHTAMRRNESLKMGQLVEYGERSITNLLPIDSRSFMPVIGALIKGGIQQKSDLIFHVLETCQDIKHIGPVKVKIVRAMRNLIIAESKIQSSK